MIQPAHAGGSGSPERTPVFARKNKRESRMGRQKSHCFHQSSVALFEGSLDLNYVRTPGLTPGATLCRHLRWLVET
jgi:hypothetical protein